MPMRDSLYAPRVITAEVERTLGQVAVDPKTGEKATWAKREYGSLKSFGGSEEEEGLYPYDDENIALLDLVHPVEWEDPLTPPDFVYDLVAIGAGAGGLVSAKQSARRGFKSALIEKHLAGGDCLNIGCVPSKALIRCARAIKEVQRCSEFGIELSGKPKVNFGAIMERMRKIRVKIAPADSHAATTGVGAAMYQGEGRFTGRNTIQINGKTIRFRKAVVATGGSAFIPDIPGLAEAPYHTNASLFNLTELPERMVVIGAGPVGLEMAQAFAAFGSQVTVLQRGVDILPKEDVDAAKMIRKALEEDGVKFITGVTYKRVSVQLPLPASGHPKLTIEIDVDGKKQELPCSVLLVAAGRRPNVNGLGLEAAGVKYDAKKGVYISDTLQTSNPNIFAVGDVSQPNFFTHVAGTMAMMTVQNALFDGDDGKLRRYSDLTIPRVTFTEPE
eukprot:gene8559-10159_t